MLIFFTALFIHVFEPFVFDDLLTFFFSELTFELLSFPVALFLASRLIS